MKRVSLGRITAAIYRMGLGILGSRLSDLDISSGQIDFLYVISLREGINQNELSEFMFVEKSATAKVVKNLEARGYIERRTDSNDKRANCLYLTTKGRAVSPKIQATFQDMLLLYKKYLTEEEAVQTMICLEKVLKGLLEEKEKDS